MELRLLAFALLATVIVIGLYYELKVADKKKEARREARAAREELYNLVVTTEAIADSLRHQGVNVGEAETLAQRARLAYESRDSVKARALAAQARRLMADARAAPAPVEDADELDFGSDTEAEPWEVKELPDDNSLPSRFLIDCARSDLEAWEGGSKEPVQFLLEQAENAALDGDYDRALALANKARCHMRTGPCTEEKERPRSCPGCFQSIEPDDRFCSRCGQSLS